MKRLVLLLSLLAAPVGAQQTYVRPASFVSDPATCAANHYGWVYRNSTTDRMRVCLTTGWQDWPGFPILAPDGSAAAPSYSFASGTSTGMYREASYLGSMLGFAAVGAKWLSLGDGGASSVWQLGPTAGVTGKNPGISKILGVSAAAGDTDIQGGRIDIDAGAGTGAATTGGLGLQSYIRIRVAPNATTGTSLNPLKTIAEFQGRRWILGGADTGPMAINSGGDTPQPSHIFGIQAAGTNVAGGDVYVEAGPGTGNAVGSLIYFTTPTVGASGSTVQTRDTRQIIGPTGVTVTGDVTFSGHLRATGTAPTLSSCGTDPSITGSDGAGIVITGSGGTLQSCTLTFASTWTNRPACIANNETQVLVVRAVSTPTTLVIDCAIAGCLESDTLTYICKEGS